MENLSIFNLIMAAAIAIIIAIIAIVKNPKIKAIVYGLPIPITLALIATQKEVDGSHIIGLFLLTGFLWLVYWLFKFGANIVLADIFSAIIYASAGYFLLKIIPIENFYSLAIAYFVFWILFAIFIEHTPVSENEKREVKKINPFLKMTVVFPLAFALLYLKGLLVGVVVTFPFSGVFVVVETRKYLKTIAWEFTKNSSISILIFLIVIHILSSQLGLYASIFIGWIVYLTTLKLISKL